jgi:hypothetical protein
VVVGVPPRLIDLSIARTVESAARRSEERTVRFPKLVSDAKALGAQIPPLLAEIIFAMLARNPAERPTAREAADALEPLVADVPHRFTVTPRLRFIAQR